MRIYRQEIKTFEKACLLGLLCRYRPEQLAFKLTFYGRTEEIAKLEQWIMGDRCGAHNQPRI